MDNKNYLNNMKKPAQRPWHNNIQKKFTAPISEMEKPTKQYRMSSMTKPTRALSNNFNYGINGINYVKKRNFEVYDNDAEVKAAQDQYKGYRSKLVNNNHAEDSDDQIDDETMYKSQIYALTK